MPRLGKKRFQELKTQITENMNKHIGHKMYRHWNKEFIGTFEKLEFHSDTDLSKCYLKFKESPFANEYLDTLLHCECEVKK